MLYASTNPQSASSHDAAAPARGTQPLMLTFANVLVNTPARLVAALVERHRTARTIAQLEALPDHLLADIGIERPDIANVVRNSRC